MTIFIRDDELLVGNETSKNLGEKLTFELHSFKGFTDKESLKELGERKLQPFRIKDDEIEDLIELIPFWRGKSLYGDIIYKRMRDERLITRDDNTAASAPNIAVMTGTNEGHICAGYEKLLKSRDYKLKYEKAMEYYAEEEYVRAATLFDQIALVFRGTDQADTVYYLQAMSYFNQNDYILSGHYFRTFARTYGGSLYAEEAEFMGAYCYYLTSPRPELDQTNTVQAIQAFQLYLIKYPDSKRHEEVQKYFNELRDKLVEKSYLSAKLYYDLSDYKASIVALNNSLLRYPESKYREEIMFMLVKSSFMLADRSILSKKKERFQDTIDEFYSFAAEFPESKFMKEARRYYRLSARYLGEEVLETQNDEES